jgi:hypothetical protein
VVNFQWIIGHYIPEYTSDPVQCELIFGADMAMLNAISEPTKSNKDG